jgi:hypothetical protein
MASEKKVKVAKGAKPKDRRPSRLRKTAYGMVLRHRAGKGKGARRQAQHRAAPQLHVAVNGNAPRLQGAT